MKDLVSIIIPIYNSSKYLMECLDSVINQTYSNLEILLINDGSTDNSKDICESYLKNDKRIKLYNQNNSGPSVARNKGLSLANGKYIIFIDSDDFIELDMIEKMYNVATDKNVDVVVCAYNEVYEDKIKTISVEKRNSFSEYLYETSIQGYICNKLVKKDCIKKEFDIEIRIMEDLIFWNENLKYINTVELVNEPLYNYRILNSSLMHSKTINKNIITSLDACNYLVNNIDKKYVNKYMIIYMYNYLHIKKYLKDNIIDYINKYNDNYQNYYRYIMKDKAVSKTTKLKFYLKSKFKFLIK